MPLSQCQYKLNIMSAVILTSMAEFIAELTLNRTHVSNEYSKASGVIYSQSLFSS